MRPKFIIAFVILFMGLSVISTTAAGQGYGNSIGARIGLGFDPDQFVVGAQTVMGRVMKVARFAPSADIGFGDNVTVITFNPDIRILFTPPKSNSVFYGQVGPTIAIIDPKVGDGDTEIGLTVSAGLKLPMGGKNYYSLEGRLGIGDVPEVRLLLGILFGGGKGNTGMKNR